MEFIAGETYAGESEESLTAAKMQKPPGDEAQVAFSLRSPGRSPCFARI